MTKRLHVPGFDRVIARATLGLPVTKAKLPGRRKSTRSQTAGHSKYGNVPTVVNGVRFASKREARRYGELKLLEKAGEITELRLQPAYPCKINGVLICTYVADFEYREKLLHGTTERIVEDVKGVKTAVYKLKKKLVRALHGIEIREV